MDVPIDFLGKVRMGRSGRVHKDLGYLLGMCRCPCRGNSYNDETGSGVVRRHGERPKDTQGLSTRSGDRGSEETRRLD